MAHKVPQATSTSHAVPNSNQLCVKNAPVGLFHGHLLFASSSNSTGSPNSSSVSALPASPAAALGCVDGGMLGGVGRVLRCCGERGGMLGASSPAVTLGCVDAEMIGVGGAGMIGGADAGLLGFGMLRFGFGFALVDAITIGGADAGLLGSEINDRTGGGERTIGIGAGAAGTTLVGKPKRANAVVQCSTMCTMLCNSVQYDACESLRGLRATCKASECIRSQTLINANLTMSYECQAANAARQDVLGVL